MTAVVLVLIFAILGVLVYLLRLSIGGGPSYRVSEPPPDPEKVMQAAVDLHRIRRRLDAADLRTRQRRDARQVRREITDALDDDQ